MVPHVIQEYIDTYNNILNNYSDPRSSKWFLMSSPWPALLTVITYLIIVIKGPKWMEKRRPFELRYVLIGYNFCLVLLSIYMCYEFFMVSVMQPGFSLVCASVDYSNKPSAVRLAKVCWWYWFSKVIELADTVFFILRKKNGQITFLHVYHHASMVLLWWIGVKFIPGGEAYFSGVANSFIHVFMYSYYLLASFGPHMQKYLWWKRYMTKMQLIQFVAILGHISTATFLNCGVPIAYQWSLIFYSLSLIVLFSNFYYHTYRKKRAAAISKQVRPVSQEQGDAVQNSGLAKEVKQD